MDKIKLQITQISWSTWMSAVEQEFGISWRTLSWEDLDVPLYSALATIMYLSDAVPTIPRDVAGQADIWLTHFDSHGTRQIFIEAAQRLDQGTAN